MERAGIDGEDAGLEIVLEHLKASRAFDFTGYKRASLGRRVRRRMQQVGVERYPDYVDHLQVNADEFAALFNTILINVTGFFRDPDAWAALRDEVLPELLGRGEPGGPLRVWSAGCASGQEAYTLAIVLAELLGVDEYRRRVKIYATDVDEEALAQARAAAYGAAEVEGVDADLLERYFERAGDRWTFRNDLRRTVIFGRNDLVQDAPISRIDLLVCRNTLMYVNADTQAKILARYHVALVPAGVLFLGKAEMLLSHTRLFSPVDLKRRLFRRVEQAAADPSAVLPQSGPLAPGWDGLRDRAFAASPVAQLVVTAEELLALVNQEAERLLGLGPRDLGRPLRDLEVSYRPFELRSLVERVLVEQRPHRVAGVLWPGPDGERSFEVALTPLSGRDGRVLGVAVSFLDTSEVGRLVADLEQVTQQLESAYEELQSTIEELETTNEELQSTIEELETTNEELQSANDELQASGESERDRTSALEAAGGFLGSVLSSVRPAVVVIDPGMRVQVWNRAAEELWGLRRGEVEGEHLLNLDVGFAVEALRPLVRGVLADPSSVPELAVDGVNRRGRPVAVRIVCSALRGDDGAVRGATLVMDPTPVGEAVP